MNGRPLLPPDMEAEKRRATAGTLAQRGSSPMNVATAALVSIGNDAVKGVCPPVEGGRTNT